MGQVHDPVSAGWLRRPSSLAPAQPVPAFPASGHELSCLMLPFRDVPGTLKRESSDLLHRPLPPSLRSHQNSRVFPGKPRSPSQPARGQKGCTRAGSPREEHLVLSKGCGGGLAAELEEGQQSKLLAEGPLGHQCRVASGTHVPACCHRPRSCQKGAVQAYEPSPWDAGSTGI